MVRRLFAVLVAFAMLFVASAAGAAGTAAWAPPPLKSHVVDTAGALTPSEAHALDMKLDRARQETGFAIVVYLLPSLPDGLSIEDVGYKAGNAWGVGSAKGDDGVVLINAVAERELRIETGKGVGGALTDVQSSHINRDIIGPLLKQGRTYDALNAGTDEILKELVDGTPGGTSDPGRGAQKSKQKGGSAIEQASTSDLVRMGLWIVGLIGVIVLAIVSPTFRSILFWILFFGRGGRGGGGGGWGGGGGGDGGSGYGGGGGSFGGGGSSDGY